MPDFYVHHPAIEDFAEDVGDLSTAASKAKTYHSTYCDVAESDGYFFATFINTASSVYAAVESSTGNLRAMMSESRLELDATWRHYSTMDETTAANLDATY